jgi:hypothetical protein
MALKLLKVPLHIVTLCILFIFHTSTILSTVSAYNEKKVHYHHILQTVIIYVAMNTTQRSISIAVVKHGLDNNLCEKEILLNPTNNRTVLKYSTVAVAAVAVVVAVAVAAVAAVAAAVVVMVL